MKIIVALDRTEKDAAVLRTAADLARAMRAEVVLLNVVNPLIDAAHVLALSTGEAMERVTAERQRYLDERARQFPDGAVQTVVASTRHGEDVAGCVARVAKEHSADLLVIASKRATGLSGLLGSVAQALLRIGPCPIVVVPPDRRAGTKGGSG
jgi:universal stress protein A